MGKKAFIRLRDVRLVDVLSEIETRRLHDASLAQNPEARSATAFVVPILMYSYRALVGGIFDVVVGAKTRGRGAKRSMVVTTVDSLRFWFSWFCGGGEGCQLYASITSEPPIRNVLHPVHRSLRKKKVAKVL